MKMKTKWQPVMEGYEVETCVELTVKDGDFGGAKWKRFDFVSLDEAKRKAKELVPNDKFGSVMISPFTLMPRVDSAPMHPNAWRKVYGDTRIEISE